MSEISDTVVKPSIESLIHEIETRANKADDHVIAAALQLRELRQRIEAGELGETVKWMTWARANFRKLSPSRLYELNAIAEADDPRDELERQRQHNREKVRKHREKTAAMEPERKKLKKWVNEASIDDVRIILLQVERKAHDRELRAALLSGDRFDNAA